ncbi:MAG TPA: glycosyltransferase family 4 protein [Phycisphaerae bacterium]|nr:glycosyltransferase family 4 protein [Phycisphaerae bacterium]HQA00217.1 glycosyltransferase family 4 protein [Phycisphaerae bacterium]
MAVDGGLDEFSLLMAPGPVHALLVVDNDVLQRMGTVARHLCVGMIDEAVQLSILSRSTPCVAGEFIGPSRIVTPPRGWMPWPRRLSPDELRERLGGNRPQIVHCLSSELAHWARGYADAWNSALIVHLNDLRDIRMFGDLSGFPHITAITATSVIERALLKAFPQMQGRVHTVPPGIPSADEIACFAAPDQVPAVLMTTPLEHGAGIEIALKALHTIAQTGQELHVFVLSDGRAEPAFRRQLDRYRLRSMVTFTGMIHELEAMRAAMSASDLYLLPVAPERHDSHVLMAMATGLAVIAPNDTIEDYLIDGRTARLFEPRPGDLAEKWLSLLQDRDEARRLAQGALDYVKAYHKASFMVCAVAVLYRQAIGRMKAEKERVNV